MVDTYTSAQNNDFVFPCRQESVNDLSSDLYELSVRPRYVVWHLTHAQSHRLLQLSPSLGFKRRSFLILGIV